MPPTSWNVGFATVSPGVSWMKLLNPREFGIVSITSLVSTCCARVFWTSTTGLSPVTVTVSSRLPTPSSALMVAVKPEVNCTPSRTTVLNPTSVNVTEYSPGRRSMME